VKKWSFSLLPILLFAGLLALMQWVSELDGGRIIADAAMMEQAGLI
jgi:hypothetical protein